jgi:hypothetical protein
VRQSPAHRNGTGEALSSPVSCSGQPAQTTADGILAKHGPDAAEASKAAFAHYRHRWLGLLARDSKLPGAALKVAVLMWELTNAERRCAWPSLRYIAEELDMDKSTAVRSLNTLDRRGWLRKVRRGGRHRSNEYRITLGLMDDDED